MKYLFGVLAGIVFAGLMGTGAQAMNLNIGPHWEGVKDSTGWVTGFHDDSVAQAATGLCSGVFIKVENKGKHVADLISPCVLGATTYEADVESQTDLLAGFKILDFMGVNAGVYYAPTRTEPREDWYDNLVYGFGINLVGLGQKF